MNNYYMSDYDEYDPDYEDYESESKMLLEQEQRAQNSAGQDVWRNENGEPQFG